VHVCVHVCVCECVWRMCVCMHACVCTLLCSFNRGLIKASAHKSTNVSVTL
jgi:hypothetical protein